MRSVFTVDIPNHDGEFPADTDIREYFRRFGLEPSEISAFPDELSKAASYKELASGLFEKMPEIARSEQEHVIFYGFLADDQAHLVITRRVVGQITLRLLHQELPKLQDSSAKLVKKLLKNNLDNSSLHISNQRVQIYEHLEDRVIIVGRVIPGALRETIRVDKKDTFLAFGALILLLPLLLGIVTVDPANVFISGTMERLSTALITTALVSSVGLVQTYYEIRRHKTISWIGVSGPSQT